MQNPNPSNRAPVAAIDTVPPGSVIELPLSFQSGALTTARHAHDAGELQRALPVALIVAGSGLRTEMETRRSAARPEQFQPVRNTAWQLADAGIASVRYDKRALGENLQKINLAETSIDDFIADVTAGARKLAADRRFSKVVLIGHSEGAELVLQAANRGAPPLPGL